MDILAREQQLRERGQLVLMDPPVYNAYAGEKAYRKILPLFQIHFPSWEFKVAGLIPLLERLTNGEYRLSAETLLDCKGRLLNEVDHFWQSRRSPSNDTANE